MKRIVSNWVRWLFARHFRRQEAKAQRRKLRASGHFHLDPP